MTTGASRASYARLRARLEDLAAGAPGVPAAAGEAADLGRLSADLSAVALLLTREGALRRSLADAAAPVEARQELATRLFAASLAPASLALLRQAVAAPWAGPAELSAAVEQLGQEALLREALAAGELDDVEDELFRFGRILDREPELALALSGDAVAASRKQALLDALLEGRARAATIALLRRAVEMPYAPPLKQVATSLGVLAADLRGRVLATVRSARPLSAQQTARLTAGLREFYGRDVAVQVGVEPGLLGGLSVQLGDDVLDGSVRRRLLRARRGLAG